MWPVVVKRTEIQQNQDHAVGETRAKLMEIADNIESGKYSNVSIGMVAIDCETNCLVVSDLTAGNLGIPERSNTVWSQVSAQIIDSDELTQAYAAFALDMRLNYESFEDPSDPDTPDIVNVSFGSENDEDDFEGISFLPSEAVHPQLKTG